MDLNRYLFKGTFGTPRLLHQAIHCHVKQCVDIHASVHLLKGTSADTRFASWVDDMIYCHGKQCIDIHACIHSLKGTSADSTASLGDLLP